MAAYRQDRDKIFSLDFTSPVGRQQAAILQPQNDELYEKAIETLEKLHTINTNYAKDSWKDTTTLFHHSVNNTIIIILASVLGMVTVKSITSSIELLNK